eukprot:CAMPEP_0167744044 /NCGR_PEP_ID=MMETSP0110_2-20121227/2361_1 /TAXON_ID=629695 /ORGANISM="Gymnochlora sp., Strain CCMP2014" /LENGTH=165 /DNA_ID=CAMNT_0007628499 /DNA_START=641 /DNA_END=1138 /DNA_ORIENTATION=+
MHGMETRMFLLKKVNQRVQIYKWGAIILGYPTAVLMIMDYAYQISARPTNEPFSSYFEAFKDNNDLVIARVVLDIIIVQAYSYVIYYAWEPIACLGCVSQEEESMKKMKQKENPVESKTRSKTLSSIHWENLKIQSLSTPQPSHAGHSIDLKDADIKTQFETETI